MRRLHAVTRALCLGVLVCVALPALAQQPKAGAEGKAAAGKTAETKPAETKPAEQPKEVKVKAGKKLVTIPRPQGWIVGQAPRGSLALFRPASGEAAQIEVKFTAGLDAKLQSRYFTAFHASLKRMGLTQSTQSAQPAVGVFPAGKQVEYAMTTGGKPYRMIVTQFYHEKGAWMVVGFFPEESRDTHLKSLQAVLATLKLS